MAAPLPLSSRPARALVAWCPNWSIEAVGRTLGSKTPALLALTRAGRVVAVSPAAADEALGDQRGAVVALDPRTGEILAMVSHPDFDPTPLVSHNTSTEKKAWEELNSDPSRPLVNRAISGNLYPPGSVFKIVTAAAAIEDGQWDENSSIPGPAVLDLPQTEVGLPNSHAGACGPNDMVTLAVAMQDSCNTAFGWLGMELGGDAVRDQAAKFGFGDDLEIPMNVTPSTVNPGMATNAPPGPAALESWVTASTPSTPSSPERASMRLTAGRCPWKRMTAFMVRPCSPRVTSVSSRVAVKPDAVATWRISGMMALPIS